MGGRGIGRRKPLIARISFSILNIFIVLLLIASINFAIFRTYGDEHWLVPRSSRELRDMVVEELRLDESLVVQYSDYLVSTFTGDFYKSTGVRKFADVESLVYDNALRTICLLAIVSTASVLIGMAWGTYSSRNAEKTSGKLLHTLAVLSLPFPVFQSSIAWLSTRNDLGLDLSIADGVFDEGVAGVLKYVILPTFSLIVAGSGYFAIITRAGLLQARQSNDEASAFKALDYVNPFPYYLLPLLMIGILGMERVYGYDGLGFLIGGALDAQDVPVLMACFFLVSTIVFFFQLAFRAVRERGRFLYPVDDILGPSESAPNWHASHLDSERQEKHSFALLKHRLKRIAGAYVRHGSGVAAFIILAIILLSGFFADVLSTVPSPWEAESRELNVIEDGEIMLMNPWPPSLSRSPYSGFLHPLGTDFQGRDVYSMNLYAAGNGMIIVLTTCAISILLGLLVGLLTIASAHRSGPLCRLGKCSMTVVSQAMLAIPATLIVISLMVSPYGDTVFGYPYRILIQAPPVIFLLTLSIYCWAYRTISRPLSGSLPSFVGRRRWRERLKDSKSQFRRYLPLVLSRTLHVTKYTVVFVIILSSVYALFLFYIDIVPIWDHMLMEVYSYGAFAGGYWWWIAVPLAGVLLLVVSSYYCIDTLERALIEMAESDAASDRSAKKT